MELLIVWLSQGEEADRKVLEALPQSSFHVLKSRSVTGLDWQCYNNGLFSCYFITLPKSIF